MKTVNLMVDVSIPVIQHITSFQGLQLPKKNDPKYPEKLCTSLVSEFISNQSESGNSTIPDFTAFKWLRGKAQVCYLTTQG